MTSGREVVLARIRAALDDAEPAPEVPRSAHPGGTRSSDEIVGLFVRRLEEYRASVVEADRLSEALVGMRLVVPADLAAGLRPRGVEVVEDDGLDANALDGVDGALTTCAVACAATGTIALTGGPGEGRRALTLVPDLHVCVVPRDRVVETVPELFDALAPAAREGRPIVLVSGPSATSDIELERIEGVHGPRRLVVSIVSPAGG